MPSPPKIVRVYMEQRPGPNGTVTLTPLRVTGLAMLRPSQAARMMGKNTRTIQRMCDEGKFPRAIRPGSGKSPWWQIPAEDIAEYLKPPAN